jgi:hypothetical protein
MKAPVELSLTTSDAQTPMGANIFENDGFYRLFLRIS